MKIRTGSSGEYGEGSAAAEGLVGRVGCGQVDGGLAGEWDGFAGLVYGDHDQGGTGDGDAFANKEEAGLQFAFHGSRG